MHDDDPTECIQYHCCSVLKLHRYGGSGCCWQLGPQGSLEPNPNHTHTFPGVPDEEHQH